VGTKTDTGKECHDPEIQAVVIGEQSCHNDRIQEENTDAVEIPEMKRHTRDDPVSKGWRTLDQRKNAVDIGYTATHHDHCSAPPCVFLVNQKGDNNCKSESKADVLDVHYIYFVQFVYKNTCFEKI
jgi:hypothetical protein